MGKLTIPVLLATNRAGARSADVARFIFSEVKKRQDIETRLFDAGDFHFPPDNYGRAINSLFPEWRETMAQSDGLIIVTPEYNHGYPGVLKAILDTLFPEYKHKAAGVVGVSSGSWGGVRAVENLIPVLVALGFAVAVPSLYFPNVQDQFHNDGRVKDGSYYERVGTFLDEVVWLARTLKHGRESSVLG